MKKLFLDSSVLFTAVNSPTGGSAKLFTLKSTRLYTSPVVLIEVERNIRKKLHSYHLERFFMLVTGLTIVKVLPSNNEIEKAKEVIAEKDAVILAAVKLAKLDLVTLDKRHFLTSQVEKFLAPKKVLTPKILLHSLEKL